MDILFKSHFILTEELLLECRTVFNSKWDTFLGLFSFIIALCGVVFLERNLQVIMSCAVLLLCAIGFIFILPKLRCKRMYKQSLIINNNKPAEETINFYNEYFESISSNGLKISVFYDNIKKIHNKENMLVFVSKQNLITFVKKDGFEPGTYDNFKVFMHTKSNLNF